VGERPNLSKEEFIDDIPYPETQNYVRRILGTAEDYRRIYGAVAGGVLADDEIPGAPAGEAVSDVTPQAAGKKAQPAPKKKPAAKPTHTRRAAA
jgi:soluble lytic murein transglycosylase